MRGGNECTRESAPDVASKELCQEKQVGGPVNCSDSELCTFLQALGEGYLPTYYSDTSQSVQSKSMSIVSRSYQRGKKTVAFHGFPSLQMSRNLTENLGEELLTSFLAGFPARTLALQEINQELQDSEAECGNKWHELLAKYDPDTHSLKIAQTSLIADLIESYVTLPRWGFMLNGALFRLENVRRHTCGSEYGLLPTPTCTDHKGSTPYQVQRRQLKNNGMTLREWLAKFSEAEETVYPNPGFLEKVMGMPGGWTELVPLEMHKFQQWQQQHFVGSDD